MELRDVVRALLAFDTLAAREWVQDAARAGRDFSREPRPEGLSEEELALAAGVVELLAARAGMAPPEWTPSVPAAPRIVHLVRAAHSMRRLRADCEQNGPEQLRRRGFYAPPEFLTFA
jgi:hypothetical protein